MQKIMFNDKYSLTKAVLDGIKTHTRRIIPLTDVDREYLDSAFDWDLRESIIIDRYARYKVGKEVAIAQSYKDIEDQLPVPINKNPFEQKQGYHIYGDSAGWHNKMFVWAELMPHRIRIINIRIERLQDISDEDCMKEGVRTDGYHQKYYTVSGFKMHYSTPQLAFASLIDRTCGKGTWESNPYVFVYEFELIK